MEEQIARGNDAAGPRIECSTRTVARAQPRGGQGRPVDRHVFADVDVGARYGCYHLDQRRGTAWTGPGTEIATIHSEFGDGTSRRADENEIADGSQPIERLDPPKTDRLTRCQVDPEFTEPGVIADSSQYRTLSGIEEG